MDRPWRMAPAWPERPEPCTETTTSNCPERPVTSSGWAIIMRSTGRANYTVWSRSLIVNLPEPGLIQTLAMAFLRLPVA